MTSKSYHLGVHIMGMLKRSDRQIAGMLSDDDGRSMSASEIRRFLQGDLAKGYEVWAPCDNRAEDGGCAGHVIEEIKESA